MAMLSDTSRLANATPPAVSHVRRRLRHRLRQAMTHTMPRTERRLCPEPLTLVAGPAWSAATDHPRRPERSANTVNSRSSSSTSKSMFW